MNDGSSSVLDRLARYVDALPGLATHEFGEPAGDGSAGAAGDEPRIPAGEGRPAAQTGTGSSAGPETGFEPARSKEDGTESPARADGETWIERVEPTDLESPSQLYMAHGVTPTEFFVGMLEDSEGRLRQQAFSEATGWADSTISRHLKRMEDDGDVVRVPFGREKLVYLPEVAPTGSRFDVAGDGYGPGEDDVTVT